MENLKKVVRHYIHMSAGMHRFAYLAFFMYAAGFALIHVIRPYVLKNIVDGITVHTMTPEIAVGLFFACNLFFNIFLRLADYGLVKFELGMILRLYSGGLRSIMSHSADFFANTYAGKLVARNRKYSSAFEILFEEFLYRILVVGVYTLGVVFISFTIHVWIGIIMTTFMILQLWLSVYFFKKKIVLDGESATRESLVTGVLSDIIGNARTILFDGKRDQEVLYFEEPVKQYEQTLSTTWFFGVRARFFKGVLATSFELTMIYYLIYLFYLPAGQGISIGEVMLGISFMFALGEQMWSLDGSFKHISKAIADASEMIDEVIEYNSGVKNYTEKDIIPRAIGQEKNFSIVFDNIAFGYPQGRMIFERLNLIIPPGETVGVCGKTGSGKTTLINLILRKMDPLGGSIFLGDINIKTDIHQDTLKNFFSYTPQDIEMFGRTIRENLLFAKKDATEQEIVAAAKRACIHDFIMSTKNGYDTMVGEKGTKLSGGQKQRLGLARAILKNAQVIILDESTSAMDTITEREVMKVIEKEFNGKTIIIIAHRLSTIRNMDRILVLGDGGIVQDGNHSTLLQQDGHYRDLYQAQLNSFDDADSGFGEKNFDEVFPMEKTK